MKKYEECQDDELIRRLRDGDGSVMDYLMEKYKDLVRRKARLMYLPGADQEDLIQEGMIGLFKVCGIMKKTGTRLFPPLQTFVFPDRFIRQ